MRLWPSPRPTEIDEHILHVCTAMIFILLSYCYYYLLRFFFSCLVAGGAKVCLYAIWATATGLHGSFFSLRLPGPFFQTGWPWQTVYMLRFFGLSVRGTYAFIGNSMASGVWGRFDEAQKAHEALFSCFFFSL